MCLLIREIEDGVKGSERVQQKLHACESFLDELEEALAGDTAKNYSGLLDMLAVHQVPCRPVLLAKDCLFVHHLRMMES